MNTKKRNKNKSSKPPTPTPPQKDDVLVHADTTAKNVEEISEVTIKSEERVPEIISEVITPIEAKVSEDDTPKKPKRNRGKKKKGDKEGDNKIPREISAESHHTDSEIKVDKSTDEPRTKTPEIPVTPAARKKKNKNKKQAGQLAEKEEDEQKLNIVPISKEEFMPDLKIINLVPVATEGLEEGKSKKKNKKKKRLDSEKSDKAEEVVSCTTAFQTLLEPKDDRKEIMKDEKNDTNLPIPQETVSIPEQDKTTEIIKEVKKELCASDNVDKPNETFKEEGKSKKKNKKDKKLPPKFETEVTHQPKFEASLENLEVVEKVDSAEENLIDSAYAQKEDISKGNKKYPKLEKDTAKCKLAEEKETDIPIDIRTQQIESAKSTETKHIADKSARQTSIPIEESPKSKAKIVKPVDKKIKQTTDDQHVEEISTNIEIEQVPIKIVDTIVFEPLVEVTEPAKSTEQLPELPIEEFKIDIEIKTEAQESKTDNKQPTEQIQVPEERGKKKRKKSPKPSKGICTSPDLNREFDDTIPKRDSGNIMHIVEKSEENVVETEETNLQINEAQITIAPIETSIQSLPQAQPLFMISKEDIKQVEEHKPVENILGNILVQSSPPIKDNKEKVEIDKLTEIFVQKPEPIKKESTPIPLSFTEEPPSQSKLTEISDTLIKIKDTEVQTEFSKTEQMQLTQSESGKRRKKSPKPKRADVTPEQLEPMEEQKTAAPEKYSEGNVQESKESLDLPPLEDIEIRSINEEESDGLICDTVPEVHQPRATSLDNNNNMVIREVTSIDEGKLNIPFIFPDTPIIQGSGETPTPGISSTGITVTEFDLQSKPEEKTDLKSKVIEVNKDMEYLRQSIERSLAELTAMEKSEEQTEKKFEEAQAKIEAIKNLSIKQETSVNTEASTTTKDDSNLRSNSEIEILQVTEQQTKLEEQKPIIEINQSKTDQSKADIKTTEIKTEPLPVPFKEEILQVEEQKPVENVPVNIPTPPPPPRKDNKGKNKRKKGKQIAEQVASTQSTTESTTSTTSTTSSETKESKTEDKKNEDKSEQKADSKEEKGKQQSTSFEDDKTQPQDLELVDLVSGEFEPIENFEDALMSNDATEDVNKTFELIANEANSSAVENKPDINVVASTEDEEKTDGNEKVNPVSQPKNLLGHPDIPARLNRADYKKEKNKPPNTKQAKVKIKDSVPIELNKQSKECQTENKRRFLKDKTVIETVSSIINDDEEYIYKYSFRRVFLPSACHTCKKDLKFGRSPCSFCNLIFYCGPKHRDEDYPQHQALCFAVSTIAHLKGKAFYLFYYLYI